MYRPEDVEMMQWLDKQNPYKYDGDKGEKRLPPDLADIFFGLLAIAIRPTFAQEIQLAIADDTLTDGQATTARVLEEAVELLKRYARVGYEISADKNYLTSIQSAPCQAPNDLDLTRRYGLNTRVDDIRPSEDELRTLKCLGHLQASFMYHQRLKGKMK